MYVANEAPIAPAVARVIKSTDGGATWSSATIGKGLPVVTVSDLYMPTDGSYLRVSTFGRGVWEIR